MRKENAGKKQRVAILTNFSEFMPGYSLTGIVKDQARMLASHGHEVLLYVSENYHGETFSEDVILKKKVPFSHLVDYRSRKDLSVDHKIVVDKMSQMLQEEMQDIEIVFSHDFVFTGWNLPYGLGIMEAGRKLPNVRWLHWIHSTTTAGFDWWRIKEYGPFHKLVYPNECDRIRVAEQYWGEPSDVRVIPHIKDLRSWSDWDTESCEFLSEYPNLMSADIVQVYPASVDRLEAKRVREVILIFSKMKKEGFSVCLMLANQWATGRQQKEDVARYKQIASRNGLKVGEEVIFSSDFKTPKYDVGLPKQILRDLMQCANVFIFPTREESFGLVLPEAALTSGALCVVNKSLTMQLEVSGFTTLAFDFGSYHNTVSHPSEETFLRDVGRLIIGRMRQDESIQLRTFCRQRYNWDNLYYKHYAPVMTEAITW